MVASQLDFDRPLILLIPDVLTSQECKDWIDLIKAKGTEPAPINTSRGTQIVSHARVTAGSKYVVRTDLMYRQSPFDRTRSLAPASPRGVTYR
jgi:hypothetical protein